MKRLFCFALSLILMTGPAYAQSCQDLYNAQSAFNNASSDYDNFDYDGKINQIEVEYGYCVQSYQHDDRGLAECEYNRDTDKLNLENERSSLITARNDASYSYQSIDISLRMQGVFC